MNFFQESLVHYCYEKVSAASRILQKYAVLRDGIPEAWAYAMMHLNGPFHVPPDAQEAFSLVSNAMARVLWVDADDRLTFNPQTSYEDLRIIEAAYWHVHRALVNVVVDSLRHLLDTASPTHAAKELALLNSVLADESFWDVGEHAERMAPQILDESPPVAAYWYRQRLTDWAPQGPAH